MHLLFLILVSLMPGIIMGRRLQLKSSLGLNTIKYLKGFLWGALWVVPAILLESPLLPFFYNKRNLQAIIILCLGVSIIEEGGKAFGALLVVDRKRKPAQEFNYVDQFASLIYIGLGFALLENIIYHTYYKIPVGLVRGFVNSLAHLTFFGYFCYFRSISFKDEYTRVNLFINILGLLTAVFLHFIYDFLLIAGIISQLSSIVFLFFLQLLLLFLIKQIGLDS